MSIFKAYDIRGIYPSELDEELAYKIGRAFVTFLGCKKVAVGQDMRSSSPRLFEALAKGITDQGADVIDIGFCSTPLFYYSTYPYEAGIMVTASHNPAEYNGMKMCGEKANPISGDTGIKDIENLVNKNKFISPKKKGSISKKDNIEGFIEHNLRFHKPIGKKLKVVIDAGNGMAGYTYPKVFGKIKDIEVIPMYFDVDMTFPNHEANPLKLENVKDLQKKVLEEHADFGVAVDGDCDRCMFIDEKGNYISADLITALVGRELLKENKGSTVLFDLRSSWAVEEEIIKAGGRPLMCRVGHAFIKKQMKDEGAIFAGELSGHFYYKDSFTTESSIITILIMSRIIREEGKALSRVVSPLKRYYAIEETNFEVKDKERIMKMVAERYSHGKVSLLDGIKVTFEDFWFNVRPSNTEPLLRLTLEAKTKKKRDEMLKNIKEMINDA